MEHTSNDSFSLMKRLSMKSAADRRTSRSPQASRHGRGNDSIFRLKIRQRSPLLRSRFRERQITSTSLSPVKRTRRPSPNRDLTEINYSSYQFSHFNIRKRSPLLNSRSRKRHNSVMSLSPTEKRRRMQSPSRDVPDNNLFHLSIRGRSPLLHNRYSGRRTLAKSLSLSPIRCVLPIKRDRTRSPSRNNVSRFGYLHLNIRRRSPIHRKHHLVPTRKLKNGSLSPVNKRVSPKFRGRTRSRSRDIPTRRSRSRRRRNDNFNLHSIHTSNIN